MIAEAILILGATLMITLQLQRIANYSGKNRGRERFETKIKCPTNPQE